MLQVQDNRDTKSKMEKMRTKMWSMRDAGAERVREQRIWITTGAAFTRGSALVLRLLCMCSVCVCVCVCVCIYSKAGPRTCGCYYHHNPWSVQRTSCVNMCVFVQHPSKQ